MPPADGLNPPANHPRHASGNESDRLLGPVRKHSRPVAICGCPLGIDPGSPPDSWAFLTGPRTRLHGRASFPCGYYIRDTPGKGCRHMGITKPPVPGRVRAEAVSRRHHEPCADREWLGQACPLTGLSAQSRMQYDYDRGVLCNTAISVGGPAVHPEANNGLTPCRARKALLRTSL